MAVPDQIHEPLINRDEKKTGFEKATCGSVTIDGKPVGKPTIKHVTIFQNYGLFPWRSVLENVELGLETLSYLKRKA